MKAESKSLSFLKDIQTFEVPFFQRAYVWKKDNWEDLFNDLMRVNQGHFLGSLILKPLESPGVFNPNTRVSVIDGQQRLTTLSILIKAIYDFFDDATKKNVFDSVKEKLFFKKDETSSTFFIKLKHSQVDKTDYNKVIGSIENDSISSIDPQELENVDYDDDNSAHKILGCYKYFRERLDESELLSVKALFNCLVSPKNKMLVVIELDENDKEQQIFDTINSAGVRLTSTDIVKNALFQKVLDHEKNEEEVFSFYNSTWNKVFSVDEDALSYWSKKKAIGRMMRDNSEILLQSVAIIEKIFDPSQDTLNDIPDLYKRYIEKMSLNEVKQFIHTIIDYAKIYQDKIPDLTKTTQYGFGDGVIRVTQILETLGFSTFNPYILYLFKRYSNDEKTLLLRLGELEKFIMRRLIAGESPKNYNKNCVDFIQDEGRAGFMANMIAPENVLNGLSKMKNRDAALVLFWVELKRRYDSQKFDVKTLEYDYTLEHIMPQKWEEYWTDEPVVDADGHLINDSKEAKRYRNQMIYSIGNMTLLSGKLNTAIRNKSFGVKIEGSPKRKGIRAYASLSITSQDIIADVFDEDRSWNEKEIYERQEKLFGEIEQIWGNGKVVIGRKPVPGGKGDSHGPKPPKKKGSTICIYNSKGILVVKESDAAQSLVEGIRLIAKKFGYKEIADYAKDNMILDYSPLIQRRKHNAEGSSSQFLGDGYYVNSHSDTNSKIRQLTKLSKKFGMGWRFEKVKKQG